MRGRAAYLFVNAGLYYVLTYPGQDRICYSKNWRRATRRARNLGYNVKVYKGMYSKAPRDAVQVMLGSFVLPRAR